MSKIALGLFLCLCSVSAFSVTGVAIVHGTGKHIDAQKDYWTGDFVNSVRQGLDDPNNYLVVSCDFDKFMWDNAAVGCLSAQLYSFITAKSITDLLVITHSNGGNVMRWILSNPTWDPRYPTIIQAVRWVNAIAPTSAGTPLAEAVLEGNVFEQSLGWLLGFKTDAVRMQQPAWMAYYNSTWLGGTPGRAALPKGFWSIVGTDVDSAVWDSDSYCGGYPSNVGLEITQAWLDNCSDGFINCSSQTAAGGVWFYDTDKTNGDEPLSHQQSRRKCFGLDVILRNDI